MAYKSKLPIGIISIILFVIGATLIAFFSLVIKPYIIGNSSVETYLCESGDKFTTDITTYKTIPLSVNKTHSEKEMSFNANKYLKTTTKESPLFANAVIYDHRYAGNSIELENIGQSLPKTLNLYISDSAFSKEEAAKVAKCVEDGNESFLEFIFQGETTSYTDAGKNITPIRYIVYGQTADIRDVSFDCAENATLFLDNIKGTYSYKNKNFDIKGSLIKPNQILNSNRWEFTINENINGITRPSETNIHQSELESCTNAGKKFTSYYSFTNNRD